MLKQLQKKFVLINMSLVAIVLLAVFSCQLYFSWRQILDDSNAALRLTLDWAEGDSTDWKIWEGEPLKPPNDGTKKPPLVPTFGVIISDAGTTVIDNNMDVTEPAVTAAVTAALEYGSDHGTLPDLELRFRISSSEDAVRIAFSDTSWEGPSFRKQMFIALTVSFLALAAFFPVSLFLARWATKPTERSWKQQQQFVADASHELKTPLTVLLANTDILLAHPTDTIGEQRKWVEYIREEGQRMKQLTEDLLFLARSDSASAKDIPHGSVSLSDLSWNCLLSFEPVAFERSAELTGEIGENISVPGNEEQLRRLITILLDNGCKYCEEGGSVALTLKQLGDKAVLSVRNTGTPIPPEALPHLFERFFRVDPSRTRESGGHGLGLSIAQSITEHHGGKIIAESSAEQGTCFTVTLPLE